MRKKLRCVFFCISIALLLSGCWGRMEPKALSLLNSILYDVRENGNYLLIKEVMKLSGETGSKTGGGGSDTVVPIICEGKTVAGAARDEYNGRILFGGVLKARLFTENLAKKGIMPVMDFLTRDPLTDEMTFMAVVRDEDPYRIYSGIAGLADMVGNHIDDLSKTQPNLTGEAVFIRTLDFIKAYYEDGKQPVMGLIELAENELEPVSTNPQGGPQGSTGAKEYRVIYRGLAAFKGDKLVGYMDGTEARAYNFVTNNLKSTVVSAESDHHATAFKVMSFKTKIKTGIEDGQVAISVNIKAVCTIIQEEGGINLNEAAPLKPLEQAFNKQLEGEISASIQKAQQEFKSDIFGFGTYMHIQHPKDWEKMEPNWDNIFSGAKVKVTVTSAVVMSGETKKSFSLEE